MAIRLNTVTKSKLIDYLKSILDKKIAENQSLIASIKESRDSDTKSSAGDKFETARAMAQIELDKAQGQLLILQSNRAEVEAIIPDRKLETVQLGALVLTSNGNYLITVGMGKIQFEDDTVYAISMASPIAMAIKGKVKGDSVIFQGKDIKVLAIS